MTDWKREHDAEFGLRKEWSARAQKAEAEVERLRGEVLQCAIELGEAAKLLRNQFPRTAGIYDEACGRARVAIGLNPCNDEQKPDEIK